MTTPIQLEDILPEYFDNDIAVEGISYEPLKILQNVGGISFTYSN